MRTSACGLEGFGPKAYSGRYRGVRQCRDRPALFGILNWLRFAGGGIQPDASNYGLAGVPGTRTGRGAVSGVANPTD
jgi:hypothetical protein